MGHVILTRSARNDRIETWMHIASENPTAADRWLEEIDQKLKLLAEAPMLGRIREDTAPGIRSFPVGDYLILYTPRSNGIHVVRIVHGARFLPWLL